MNPSSATSYWDFCFRTMHKCCYCQSFLYIHFYPYLELLDALGWYVFAKLIYKDHLICILYDKGEKGTLSEVKTYQLELEDCHSTGTLLKRLEYVTVQCFYLFANIYYKEIWCARLTFWCHIQKHLVRHSTTFLSCISSIKYHKNKYFKILKIAFQSVAKKGKSTNCVAKNWLSAVQKCKKQWLFPIFSSLRRAMSW